MSLIDVYTNTELFFRIIKIMTIPSDLNYLFKAAILM